MMAAVTQTRTQTQARPGIQLYLTTRYTLVLGGVAIVLLSLLALLTVVNAYSTAFNLFESIAVFYGTKVDASERALQYISRTSQATADYTALSSDTPLFEQAVNDIFRNFNLYRDEMFILRSNLQSADEETAFTTADTFSYSRFWRHVANLIDGRSDEDLARREYLSADNNLRNRIIPALEALESENFDLMVDAGNRAGSDIARQVILVGVTTIGLAAVLTYLSFWLRGKVRRYITLGIDIALVIAWLVPILILLELLSLPGQIATMTENAYNSISGTSRVLVVGNLANRAESSAIIDSSRADFWFAQFDENIVILEQRLCGTLGCTKSSFLTASGEIDPNVLANAQSAIDLEQDYQTGIGVDETLLPNAQSDLAEHGVRPLIANASFDGEAQALENARVALQDYLAIHAVLTSQVSDGELDAAIELNTGADEGDSEEAFGRFVAAMDEVEAINREVFDDIWQKQQSTLPRNRIFYGIVTNLAVILLVAFGVNHRFREL
jgi:hypothetical protein